MDLVRGKVKSIYDKTLFEKNIDLSSLCSVELLQKALYTSFFSLQLFKICLFFLKKIVIVESRSDFLHLS